MPFFEEAKNASAQLAIKPCSECKHCQNHPTLLDKAHSICSRPDLPQRFDIVTGEPVLDFCSVQRIDAAGKCGEIPKFFEPIEDNFDELTTFREKSIDWWNTRSAFSRYMYEEHKDRGFDAAACSKAQSEYSAARDHYEKKYNEEFAFERRPIDVSEKAPSGVDMRISL